MIRQIPYVLFNKLNPGTLVLVAHPMFLCNGVFVFAGHQEVLDGTTSFEMYFYPMFVTNVLDILTDAFCVRHYPVDVVSLW